MSETHILVNAFSARRGGGQTYLINLLNNIPVGIGIKVTLLVSKDLMIEVNDLSVRVLKVDFPVNNPFLRAYWERVHLPFLLIRERVDVLFCPGGVISTKVPYGCRAATMFRNMIPFDIVQRRRYPLGYMRFRNWLLQRVLLKSMENADLVIFISNYAKEIIESTSNKGIKRSTVIPHGVSSSFREPVMMERPSFLPAGNYLVYVSTVDVYKSHLEVVEAYAKLLMQEVDVPPILFIGPEEGVYADKVRSAIKLNRLENKVILFGAIPYQKMPVVYQYASLVVFASQSENCPNILLESMAAGRAVLCSNMLPMPEFGEDAVVYFNPQNPEELAMLLLSVLEDKKWIKDLEKKAKMRSEMYQWRKAAEDTWHALVALGHLEKPLSPH